MNSIFDSIYDSLKMERLPGIVSFEAVTGRPLAQLATAANDFSFAVMLAPKNFEESYAGANLNLEDQLGGGSPYEAMATHFERLEISTL